MFELSRPAEPGSSWAETVLYSFCSAPGYTDGAVPYSSLSKMLWGTSMAPHYWKVLMGNGTVFEVDQAGRETVLYSFCSASGCAYGAYPPAGLIADAAGNFYGITSLGGADAYHDDRLQRYVGGACSSSGLRLKRVVPGLRQCCTVFALPRTARTGSRPTVP